MANNFVDPFDEPQQKRPSPKTKEFNFVDPFDDFVDPFDKPQSGMMTNAPAMAQQTQEEPGMWGQAKSLFTGKGRTEFPELPEFDLPFEFSGRQAKTALGLMTTFDPKRELQIWKTNYPDLVFSEDKYGNVIADASAYGGGAGYINKPGISLRDVADIGFQIAAFTPAGKAGGIAARAGGGLASRMGATAAASGATQVAQDIAGQAAGATKDVSLGNVEWGDVGIAAAAGGAFEGLSGPLGRLYQRIAAQFRRNPVVTDSIRNEFKAAMREAGRNPEEVTDDFIRSWMQAADEAAQGASVATPQAQQQMTEFGIPYTRGQASEIGKQLELEDTLRNIGGTRAAARMAQFGKTQEQAIREAAETVQRGFGGELIERPNIAGAAVREGVQARAATLDELVEEAYGQVGTAYLTGDGVKQLNSRLLRMSKAIDFERDPELVPATASLLKRLQGFDDMVKAGATIRPANLKRLESFRRAINNKIDAAKNATDKRQVTQMKRAFDNYLDGAVDNALFTGDTEALDALKKARSLRAEYARKFQRRDVRTRSGTRIKDTAGEMMERIISADPTDEQVANYLFGVTKLGSRQGSAQLAKRMKEALGVDSPEWGNIRQAAFLKLTKPPKGSETISGREFLSRLKEATQGEGETFMRELFAPQEIGKLRRLGEAIKRAQPDIRNPPRTAYKLASMVNQLTQQVARMFGWSMGGAGGIGAEAGIQGARAIGGLRQAAEAARATDIRPFARLSSVPTVGVPATVSATQERPYGLTIRGNPNNFQ